MRKGFPSALYCALGVLSGIAAVVLVLFAIWTADAGLADRYASTAFVAFLLAIVFVGVAAIMSER